MDASKHLPGQTEPVSAFVGPLARSLTILSVFTPQDRWLGSIEIAVRACLPASTVARLLRSLSLLGYVHYSQDRRKYRLGAAVLSLGYAAIAHSDIQRLALPGMQSLAEHTDTYVVLGSRDRLDVVLLECCQPRAGLVSRTFPQLEISAGMRLGIADSPLGWALLAALPEIERAYLSGKIERRQSRDWPRIRRRLNEAITQVREKGYCTALGESDPDIGIVAVSLLIQGCAPMVLACVGGSNRMTYARIDRELSVRLMTLAQTLEEGVSFDP